MKRLALLLFLAPASILLLAQGGSKPGTDSIIKLIRKHGMEKSQVMQFAELMTDVYGPRVTGSPQLERATDWMQKTLKEMGMQQVHLEAWGPFGRGWELKKFAMHADAPTYFPILAYPKVWSPNVGKVSGEVIYLDASDSLELEAFRGKLKGKFVLLDTLRELKEPFEPMSSRLKADDLLEMANATAPTPRRGGRPFMGGGGFGAKLWEFLYQEKPLGVIDRNFKGDLGTVFVAQARSRKGQARDKDAEVLPQVTMSAEQYNRLFRWLKRGMPVKLSMELEAVYTNPDGMEHNIIADIPGTDKKDEIVFFGAHFDSWHSGTGATDNAAGSAVMVEAARILQAVIKESGIQPRRTLRLGLWTGEEQGLLGSRGYMKEHYLAMDEGNNITAIKPEQSKISAYYNLDNGTGKIRGIYLQGNQDALPVFRPWLDQFKDLEANTITLQNTGGTDHLSFDQAGIPGFQFIQEPMSYFNRTHHSNMDVYDHLVADDLKQAATIVAAIVWQTAMREEMIPRKAPPSIK